MKKIKEITKNILLLTSICIILVMGLEIAYRGYRFYKYKKGIKQLKDPLIMPLGPKDRLEYIFKPNTEFMFKNDIISLVSKLAIEKA